MGAKVSTELYRKQRTDRRVVQAGHGEWSAWREARRRRWGRILAVLCRRQGAAASGHAAGRLARGALPLRFRRYQGGHPVVSDELPPVAILAGGLATRLRPITETIPKALVDIEGSPFIERQLELLRAAGIRRVVLCVGYLGHMIRESV